MDGNFNIDENGQIIIDDSMSEELKAKIMEYNSSCSNQELEDRELSDEEVDAYTSDYIEGYNDDEYDLNNDNGNIIEETPADQETLNSLNDLFM